MNWIHIIILAAVQGAAELLPVSSSAHVIVAAELLHENMSTPANSLLLVMLHTGTMFAVLVYFWRRWLHEYLSSWERFWRFFKLVFVASALSGAVGFPLIKIIEHILSHGGKHVQVEALFHKLNWVAPALAVVGVLIVIAGLKEARRTHAPAPDAAGGEAGKHGVGWAEAVWMGLLQGVAIPFRGFSRSGSTISGGLLTGGERGDVESFSFAMVIALTPLAIARELWRDLKAAHLAGVAVHIGPLLTPGLLGMVCAFIAGLLALRWLSSWLENGRWYWFGAYCICASLVVELLYLKGW